eukprot:g19542.t1
MVVVIGGQSSQLQDISAGVRHRSVLGPSIFSYFSNDLPSIIRSEVGMFDNVQQHLRPATTNPCPALCPDTEAVQDQMHHDVDNSL